MHFQYKNLFMANARSQYVRSNIPNRTKKPNSAEKGQKYFSDIFNLMKQEKKIKETPFS